MIFSLAALLFWQFKIVSKPVFKSTSLTLTHVSICRFAFRHRHTATPRSQYTSSHSSVNRDRPTTIRRQLNLERDSGISTASSCRLTSASSECFYTSTLVIPSTRRTTLGDRAFPVTVARAWNILFRRLFVLRHRCCSSAATSRRHCMFQSSWLSGRTSVSGRRTFPVLRSTCS